MLQESHQNADEHTNDPGSIIELPINEVDSGRRTGDITPSIEPWYVTKGAFALVKRVRFAGSRSAAYSGTYSAPHWIKPVAMADDSFKLVDASVGSSAVVSSDL